MKRPVRSLQEYPGTTIWIDYEYLCPDCNTWTENISDITDLNNNPLCEKCAKEVDTTLFN